MFICVHTIVKACKHMRFCVCILKPVRILMCKHVCDVQHKEEMLVGSD